MGGNEKRSIAFDHKPDSFVEPEGGNKSSSWKTFSMSRAAF
jgi:hypothetical protein